MRLVDPARRPRCALEAWLARSLPEYLRGLTDAPSDVMEAEASAAVELAALEWRSA